MSKFPDLALQLLDPVLLGARQSAPLSGVTFGLLAPDAQAIGRTAKLRCNRLAGRRVAGVVGPVLSEKPNTAFAQLGRIGG